MHRILSLFLIVPLGWAFCPPVYGESFLTHQTEHFTLTYTAQDKRIVDRLLPEIEEIRGKIIADTGKDFRGKTAVLIAPTIESFRNSRQETEKSPVGRGLLPESNLIILRSPFSVKAGHPDPVEIFAHELTHVAIGRALPGKSTLLAWGRPGPCTNRGNGILPDGGPHPGSPDGYPDPLSRLTTDFPSERDRAELAYAKVSCSSLFSSTTSDGMPFTVLSSITAITAIPRSTPAGDGPFIARTRTRMACLP